MSQFAAELQKRSSDLLNRFTSSHISVKSHKYFMHGMDFYTIVKAIFKRFIFNPIVIATQFVIFSLRSHCELFYFVLTTITNLERGFSYIFGRKQNVDKAFQPQIVKRISLLTSILHYKLNGNFVFVMRFKVDFIHLICVCSKSDKIHLSRGRHTQKKCNKLYFI